MMVEEIQEGSPLFETVGNKETMNLHNILYHNIISSPYFKSLYEKKTYAKVVEEIQSQEREGAYKICNIQTELGNFKGFTYYKMPFFKDNHASSAFCLLYKLWTLKLNEKQIQMLLINSESPYVRALGFLYLRYVCKPAYLWSWFCEWLDDGEKIQLDNKSSPTVITIGKMCRDLLTELKWQGTILPRIPVPIAREISTKLKALDEKQQAKKKGESLNVNNRRSNPCHVTSNDRDIEVDTRNHKRLKNSSSDHKYPEDDYRKGREYARNYDYDHNRNHTRKLYSRDYDDYSRTYHDRDHQNRHYIRRSRDSDSSRDYSRRSHEIDYCDRRDRNRNHSGNDYDK